MRRIALAFVLAVAAAAAPAHALTLQRGDLVAVISTGEIVRVNVGSSQAETLSPPTPGTSVRDIAFTANGTLLALASDNRVYRIDPATGARTPITSPGAIAGQAMRLTAAPDGRVFVLHFSGGQRGVSRVDPASGAVTPLTAGGLIAGATKIAFEPSTNSVLLGGSGALFRVNSVTGAQSPFVADASLGFPQSIIATADGSILVSSGVDHLTRVNPITAALSVFPLGGPNAIDYSYAIAQEPDGTVLVSGESLVQSKNIVARYFSIGGTESMRVFQIVDPLLTAGLIAVYNPAPCPADTNADQVVDFLDLNAVLSAYGAACP